VAKKKSKRDYEEEDEDEIEESSDIDDDGSDDVRKEPKSDAYTGLAFITTIALITAAVLFYLDFDKLSTAKNPSNPNVSPTVLAQTQSAAKTK
jgi:hypothetical protein